MDNTNADPQTPQISQTPKESPPPPLLPDSVAPAPLPKVHRGKRRLALLVMGSLILISATATVTWHFARQRVNGVASVPTTTTTKSTGSQSTTSPVTKATVQGIQLDAHKQYGDKYATGIVPVGDSKYSSDSAKVGYIYTCSGYARNLAADSGGAGVRGPWFTNNNTSYDLNKKIHVSGSVSWKSSFSNNVSGTTRTIVSNDLPSHPTGIFPIMRTDPAYSYDRNPNTIIAQSLTYALPVSPAYGQPQCMGGQAGIMLTGVALFNGFDAGGRDAGAWEVQDDCSGHPEKQGEYHYHTLSSCIKDTSVNTVIGYALDGFPITGPQVTKGNILTSTDLDECHGLTSTLSIDGKQVTTYHYVMTQDFPYSVSCFRGTPITPPGQPSGGTDTQATGASPLRP